jgi:hypothetical protein
LPVAALSLSLMARAEDPTSSSRRLAPPTRIPDVLMDTAQPAGETVSTSSMPRTVRRAVVADAARRFQVAEDAVVLASAELVTWSDGSLGCPQPGRSYTQMLVPGYRVTATTAGGRMLYHTDTRGNAVNCSVKPSKPSAPPAASDNASEPRTLPPPRSQPDR